VTFFQLEEKNPLTPKNHMKRDHIFISPHSDDAIASCGGTIAMLKNKGEYPVIYTMFSAQVVPPYSQEAIELHFLWGNPKNVSQMRRNEDICAAAKLGIPIYFGNQPDALYRLDSKGHWMYPKEGDIFNSIHKEDSFQINYFYELFRKIFRKSKDNIIYIPLGVGNHVDHIIAFRVGYKLFKDGYNVLFYEDFPYSKVTKLYEEKRRELSDWTYKVVTFNEKHLKRKIEAFSRYKSQIPMLFDNFMRMRHEVCEWSKNAVESENMVFGERFWVPRGVVKWSKKNP